jgi:hypothetical protein
MLSKAWWENPTEVRYVETMLVRAGAMPESERDYFRGKPYKWDKEARYAEKMEALMVEAGVDPEDEDGWSLSASKLLEAFMLAASRRRKPRECPECGGYGQTYEVSHGRLLGSSIKPCSRGCKKPDMSASKTETV